MSKRKDAKLAKNVPVQQQPRVRYVLGKVGGSVPVAPPSSHIQLTPIIQPVAMVPYATQQQPLITYIDEE